MMTYYMRITSVTFVYFKMEVCAQMNRLRFHRPVLEDVTMGADDQ